MKYDYSIDLETLGTRFDSYILSIGVAAFNIETGEILNTFHKNTVCDNNFNIDINTVMWWLNQSDAARIAITDNNKKAIPIETALNELSSFILDHKKSVVWGNGSSFGITLLDHAYHQCKLKQPWQFWNVRDMRTIVDLASVKGFDKTLLEFEGIAHDALSDAKHQAKVISEAYSYLVNGTYLDRVTK